MPREVLSVGRGLAARRGTRLRQAWRLRYRLTPLTSSRSAMLQLSLLAAVLVAAALIPQSSAETGLAATDPASWSEAQRRTFGGAYPLMRALSLFDIRDALWFKLLLGSAAGAALLHLLSRPVRPSTDAPSPQAFRHMQPRYSISWAAEPTAVVPALAALLRRRGYAVRYSRSGSSPVVVAEAGRLGSLAAPAAHLGLVIVLTGAWIGSAVSFRDTGLYAPEGRVTAVGHGTGLLIKVVDVSVTSYPQADVLSGVTTTVDLLEGGRPVRMAARISVNKPLVYKGVRLLQMDAGPAVLLSVSDGAGRAPHLVAAPLTRRDDLDRAAGDVELSTGRLTAAVVTVPRGAAGAGDAALSLRLPDGTQLAGTASAGRPAVLGGVRVALVREMQFSRLQVSYQPEAPFVWLGGVLVVAGIALSYLVRPRRIGLQISSVDGGSTLTAVRLSGTVHLSDLHRLLDSGQTPEDGR